MAGGNPDAPEAQSDPSRAIVIGALLLANAALAFGPTFVRLADTGPIASAFWRMALAVPVMFLLTKRFGEPLRIRGRGLILTLALSGMFFAGDLASWNIGILQTRMANATLFGNAASLFYPILGFVMARALPGRTQIIALLLGLAGALLLLGRSYELSDAYLVGDLFCLTAGTLYTFYLAAIARARETLPGWSLLSWSTLSTAIPLLLASLAIGENVWPQDWIPLLGFALTSQLIGQGLLIWVIDKVSPLLLGLALMSQPVISASIGWIAFGERLQTADIFGALLVAIALVLVRR